MAHTKVAPRQRVDEATWTYRADPHAPGDARRAVAGFARAHRVGDEAQRQIALAVSEAVTNVVLHAYVGTDTSGEVIVSAHHHDGSLDVTVRDRGVGMQPSLAGSGLGLGLPIIAQVADAVELHSPPDGGTEIVLHFKLRSRDRE